MQTSRDVTRAAAEQPGMAGPGGKAAGAGITGLGAEIEHRLPALRALTSLRFFAAMHVVVYHLSQGHTFGSIPLVGRFIDSGYTGVSLFFVLSGFILAYNYREVTSPRDFWISRFARIYPVYLMALLLSFAYAFAPATPHTDHMGLRLAASATLLQTWYIPFSDSFNGPGWTLSVEAFFYALFPLLAAGIGRVRSRTFGLLCGLYVLSMAAPWLMHAAAPESRVPFAVAAYLNKGELPPLHLPLFAIGVYLGAQYRRLPQRRSSWPLVAGLAGSLLLLCWGPEALLAPLRRAMLVMTYAALIYGLAAVRRGWLTGRWMVLAGEISFSIYILQMPVMRTVLGLTRRHGIGFYGSIVVVSAVLIAVSYAAYRLVELPARIAIRRILTRKPVALQSL